MKNINKIKKVGITAALTISMVGSLVVGTYAEMDNGKVSIPAQNNENIKEDSNQRITNIIEAERNIDKASKELEIKKKVYDRAINYSGNNESSRNDEALAKAKEALKNAENEVSKANSDLENAKSANENAGKTCTDAKEATEKAKDAYEKLAKENPEAADTIKQDKEDLKKKEEEHKAKQDEYNQAKSKLEQAKKARDAKIAEAEKAKTELEAVENNLKNKGEEKNQAEQKLKDAEAKLNNLKDGNPGYQEAVKKVEEIQAEIANIDKEIEEANKSLKEAKDNEAKKSQELADKQEALKKLEEKNKEYAKEHQRLDGEVAKADENVKTRSQEVTDKEELEKKSKQESEEAEKKANEAGEALTKAKREYDEAKTATEEAKSAKEKADKAVEEAERAVEEEKGKGNAPLTEAEIQAAKEQWKEGSVGFFKANGSTDAVAVFTTEKTVIEKDENGNVKATYSYLDPTRNAGKDDARDLDRMKMSIEAIAEINNKRKSDGGIDGRELSIVGINDYCMAVAQANANFSHDKMLHAEVYKPPYENLYWGYSTTASGKMSPLEGWWDEEKIIFDYLRNQVGLTTRKQMDNYIASHFEELQAKFPNKSIAVGHYTNLVDYLMWGQGFTNDDSKVAGYAIRPGKYKYVHSLQLSPKEVGKTYTYDEYYDRFMKYYNDLKLKTEGKNPNANTDSEAYKTALEKLNKAKEEQRKANDLYEKAKANEAKKLEESNKAERDKADKDKAAETAKTAYTEAQKDVKDAKTALDSAKTALAGARTALSEYDKKNSTISADINKANEEITTAEKALAEKTQAKKDIEKRLEEERAKLKADIAEATKAVETAKEALNKAGTALEQAEAAKNNALEKSNVADKNLKEAKAALVEAEAELNRKKEELNSAAEKVKAAEEKLQNDSENFKDLINASNDYDEKLAKEEKAKSEKEDAEKEVVEKENALTAAKEKKLKAETDFEKAKKANENATNSHSWISVTVAEKEYLIAVKNLNDAKIQAMMMLRLTVGNETNVTTGVKEAIRLSCNGSLKYFTGITIDGKFIPANEYTAVSGSTIVTIPSAYWSKLAAGKHTYQFNYEYGKSPIGTFTIVANEEAKEQIANPNSNRPNTGDANSYVLLSGGLFMISTLLLYRSLKRKEEDN